ncbi:Uncharacterised protein [Mycobacteroides abscessus subsp. abscessus]|nr:Uncharacterised protein [Mycobacteroides abscessus subsp. abscessus]
MRSGVLAVVRGEHDYGVAVDVRPRRQDVQDTPDLDIHLLLKPQVHVEAPRPLRSRVWPVI